MMMVKLYSINSKQEKVVTDQCSAVASLSEYEKKRLLNIQENIAILKELQIYNPNERSGCKKNHKKAAKSKLQP